MKPIYIFDLDGTLALIDHRRYLVEGEKKDWRTFFRMCVYDEPNWPVINTFHALRRSGAECWIWSARSDEVRDNTVTWLQRYGLLPRGWWFRRHLACPMRFRMRKDADYSADEQLKASWLGALMKDERSRLAAVFDDRDKVVAMWRENRVACFQVALNRA
jgi:hypothetical protein